MLQKNKKKNSNPKKAFSRKRFFLLATKLLFLFCLIAVFLSSPSPTQNRQHKEQQKEILSFSHTIGQIIGKHLDSLDIAYDPKQLLQGMEHFPKEEKISISDEKLNTILSKIQMVNRNRITAEQFLEKTEKEAKFFLLEGGKIQYTLLQEGQGEKLLSPATIKISYSANSLKGISFFENKIEESSLKKLSFSFKKGIEGMQIGEKRKIYLHPDLLENSDPKTDGDLLILEVELLNFVKK